MKKLKNVQELSELEGIGIRLSRHMENLTAKVMRNPILELGQKHSVDQGK
jgi:hypothetical protein